MKKINVINYNVYGNGIYKNERQPSIISELTKNGIPDIICLQEVTCKQINNILNLFPNYYKYTKMQYYIQNKNDNAIESLKNDSYIAIISKWDFIEKSIICDDDRYYDGIMRVVFNSLNDIGFNLIFYNVHTIGGTYLLDKNTINQKKEKRINELKILNKSIKNDNMSNIIIAGDFNYDSNINCLEHPYSPENQFKNLYDVWYLLQNNEGLTESTNLNSFRKLIKPKQNKEARYDKIIYGGNNLQPNTIKIIGNNPISENSLIYPSDHFGLFCVFILNKQKL